METTENTLARTHLELTADDIFRVRDQAKGSRNLYHLDASTVGEVALEAMQRLDEVERERDTYRDMLQLALGRVTSLTDTCRRQRQWNQELVIELGICRREAEDA